MTYKVINSIEIKFYVGFQWKNACLFKPYVENFDRKNTQNYFNLIFNEVQKCKLFANKFYDAFSLEIFYTQRYNLIHIIYFLMCIQRLMTAIKQQEVD